MNILIPHQWLLEHLETPVEPEKLSDYLSLAGPSVETIKEIAGETVYDIEVTTNRVDAMSIRGIAREAKVILKQNKVEAELINSKLPDKNKLQLIKPELKLPQITNDPKLCPRIICLVLNNVKQTPTPDWMAKRLKQIGQNIHHSLVDITNYVTHELGHPIHAFDYDRLMELGGEIIVKEAQAGKKFITLDEETHETVGGEVVLENAKGKIIDLPAIKGTSNTSINQSTKNILLWVEKVVPEKVRFASMIHDIRTMAAQLNEKDVDPHLAEPTLLRAVQLYQELCDAQIASPIFDDFPQQNEVKPIRLKVKKIDQYLGLELKIKTITTILEDLNCKIKLESDAEKRQSVLEVTPPTFRPDLQIPVDIVEEVARIYGYHRLPSKLMTSEIPTQNSSRTNFVLENKIKYFLAHLGWQEIYSYSLISEKLALESGWNLKSHLKLKNPMTEDKVYLRRSLLPSLAEIIRQNPEHEQLSVYELANIYPPQGDKELPAEKMMLGLVSRLEYRQVRGILESLLDQFYLQNYEITPIKKTPAGWQQAALIKAGEVKLGKIGLLKSNLAAVQLKLENLSQVTKKHPQYQPISKTMPIIEDMTFTLKSGTAVGPIMQTIRNIDQLVTDLKLKTIYKQNYTFSIEYHHPSKNLEVSEIEPLRKKIVKELKKEHQAKLVGEV